MPRAAFCLGCSVAVPLSLRGESDLQSVQQLGVVSRKGEGQHNLFLLALKLGDCSSPADNYNHLLCLHAYV